MFFLRLVPKIVPRNINNRKGKVIQDCNVFSRVSLATRDKAFLENCHCHGHPHERMQEQPVTLMLLMPPVMEVTRKEIFTNSFNNKLR